ncbi:MAG: hypothetical protein ACJ74E_01570, partial [Actinomycetes bacterium]
MVIDATGSETAVDEKPDERRDPVAAADELKSVEAAAHLVTDDVDQAAVDDAVDDADDADDADGVDHAG